MKVFELHFNPKEKEDTVFDSFCYEPINIDEKRLGNLYMIGELNNALPRNYKLLENLSLEIKKEYYKSFSRSAERALIESLKKGNEFLEKLTKDGDVSWLGNFNFGVLAIKNYEFHFTKVENICAFILRAGKITDITKNLIQEEMNPYPIKVFGNFASGKLMDDDIFLILTKESCDIFQRENLLNEIANLAVFNEKNLKDLLWKKEKVFKEVSGATLLVALIKESPTLRKKLPEMMEFGKIKEKFSFLEALTPLINVFKLAIKFFKKIFNRFSPQPKTKEKKPDSLKRKLKISLPHFGSFKINISMDSHRKNLILIFIFIALLVIGFYIFRFQENKQLSEYRQNFIKIQEKSQNAEQFMEFKNEKEAKALFSEAYNELISLEKTLSKNNSLRGDISSLKEKIEPVLLELNNFTQIDSPEIMFDFSQTKFAPEKMIKTGDNLYFFNPATENLFFVNVFQKSGEQISIAKKFKFAQNFDKNSLIFFSKPDTITIFTAPDNFSDKKITFPNSNFEFVDSKIFYSNLYFLEKQGEIFKCELNKNKNEANCNSWFSKYTSKKPDGALSFAIDSNILIFDKDGDLDRYWSGNYEETFDINVFPKLEEPTKILTTPTLSYLYVLEPLKNRVLIFTKSGQIVQQFQSEKFNDLKDFSVSDDGKTIWLLNELKVYQINF